TTFDVAAEPNTVVVSVPDFVRGAGQDINIPGDGTSGIPITIFSGDGNDVSGVTTVSFELDIDSIILDVTGVTLGPDAPLGTSITGTSFNPNSSTLHFNVNLGSPLTVGSSPLDIVNLMARVTDGTGGEDFTAPYAAKELLNIGHVVINNFAIDGSDDD